MDVSLSVRFTATERCERGAARRVLIDSDLSPRSTIHAPHFASSIGRLSRALQMESYPKFHNEVGVPIVRIGCREFKCIGDKPPQDHPHIYFNMGDASEIGCPYCSTVFRFDPSLGHTKLIRQIVLTVTWTKLKSSNAASLVMLPAANQRQAPSCRSLGAVHDGHERSANRLEPIIHRREKRHGPHRRPRPARRNRRASGSDSGNVNIE